MPISPDELFIAEGLKVTGSCRWGAPVPCDYSGVYAISLHADPRASSPGLAVAPVCPDKVQSWLNRVPSLSLDGRAAPATETLADCLRTFWLPDETIVYIGKATRLRSRLGQYRRHVLGDGRPHAGGHWIKTLTVLDDLWLHYAVSPTDLPPEALEHRLIHRFQSQVSASTRTRLPQGMTPIPFANREFPQGTSKQCRIGKSTL